jgi:hypothetical protein
MFSEDYFEVALGEVYVSDSSDTSDNEWESEEEL